MRWLGKFEALLDQIAPHFIFEGGIDRGDKTRGVLHVLKVLISP
jgi:hypothetical protein